MTGRALATETQPAPIGTPSIAGNAELVVAEWPRNSREVIRIVLGEYRGQSIVSVRSWYRTGDDRLLPSRSGITLSLKHLPQLAAGADVALKVARERGLI